MTIDNLTIAFINKNGGELFERALRAASTLTDDILVVDSGSTDDSQTYAERYQARWVFHAWPGSFGEQRNFTQSLVKREWLLFLDTDEILNEALIASIRETLKNPKHAVYRLRRKNCLFGVEQSHGSLGPDTVVRLYKPALAHWVGDVHERLEMDTPSPIGSLKGHLEHHTYKDFKHWRDKMASYAQAWAEEKYRNGKRVRLGMIPFKGLFAFIKAYILEAGFLDGKTGLMTSQMYCWYTFDKYCRLYDCEQNAKRQP